MGAGIPLELNVWSQSSSPPASYRRARSLRQSRPRSLSSLPQSALFPAASPRWVLFLSCSRTSHGCPLPPSHNPAPRADPRGPSPRASISLSTLFPQASVHPLITRKSPTLATEDCPDVPKRLPVFNPPGHLHMLFPLPGLSFASPFLLEKSPESFKIHFERCLLSESDLGSDSFLRAHTSFTQLWTYVITHLKGPLAGLIQS